MCVCVCVCVCARAAIFKDVNVKCKNVKNNSFAQRDVMQVKDTLTEKKKSSSLAITLEVKYLRN